MSSGGNIYCLAEKYLLPSQQWRVVRDSLVVVQLGNREYRAVYSVNTAPEVAVLKQWDRAQHQAALVINRDMICVSDA